MDDVLREAMDMAASVPERTDTSHLLIAIARGKGTAASLLRLRGLTEARLRAAVRDMEAEPRSALSEVIDRASDYARSLGARSPAALHLLAALTTVKTSRAWRILEGSGLRLDLMRNQALGCLTGCVSDPGDALRAENPRRPDPLPLAGPLRGLAAEPDAKRAGPRQEDTSPGPAEGGRRRTPRSMARRDVGHALEHVQRRTRSTRARPDDDRAPHPAARPVRQRVAPAAPRPLPRPAEEFDLRHEEFPLLSSLGRNLTREAALGRLDEIVGREREMERVVDVLNKRRANSPCLVGAPGVGKTALVEGLAIRLARGEAPGLGDRIVIEARPGDLLAGTSTRGSLAERIAGLREEVTASGNRVVIFFDEIHGLLAANEGCEAAQELKASLARGALPCIAATTEEGWAAHVESDPALARCFTRVDVCEPDEAEATTILESVAPAYCAHHGVRFDADALAAAVKLSSRYLAERALPDKAVALLDLAGARARRAGAATVSAADVAAVLAEIINVPMERIASTDRERLLDLERHLGQRIVGHAAVITALAETLRRNAAGFRTGRPIGSFLFLGPTGVGKTETAKALADLLFPGHEPMVRLDMSEFSESHAVARLVGAPPGYVGHEDGGQLTEAVRRRPYSLVLLDEIEKAHRDVIQVLLQVLDDGRLTDGRGRTVSFQNTIIVMTSNLGSNAGIRRRPVGFGAPDEASENRRRADEVLAAARTALPVELWNRIDEPLVFDPLTKSEVEDIARMLVDRAAGQLASEHGIVLRADDAAISALVAAGGYDPDLGARPMRRTIQRLVEGPVARLVLEKRVARGDRLLVTGRDSEILIEIEEQGTTPRAETAFRALGG